MVHEEWDVPLFDVPPKYRPPKRPAKYPNWRSHTGKRTSCDVCILDLAHGTTKFMAENAVHVRTDERGRRFYCSRHAQTKRLDDERRNLL